MKCFGKNEYILGLCSVATLLSFAMTIYVSLKTKSIQKALKEYRRIEKFNREGLKYAKRFKTYITSLIEDDVPFRKIRGDLLIDLHIVRKKFDNSLNKRERECIQQTISKIENGSQDAVDAIVNELSEIVAIFSEEKES